jgi:predicted metal-dependent phosphoesterase TrpH
MNTKVRLEFHCHTIASKDSLMRPEALVKTCRKKGLDRVIITDHNTIHGAQIAKEIAPDLVIVGEEIMTTKGELLAAFVTEEVPAGLSPYQTIQILREQGAFISVSHPFDIYRSGHWESEDLIKIVPYIDAIEIFNARCFFAKHNQLAQEFAAAHGLAGTAGSDAHTAFELGKATLLLDAFTDAKSLAAGLPGAKIQASLSAPWVHLTSRFAVWYKKLFRLYNRHNHLEDKLPEELL